MADYKKTAEGVLAAIGGAANVAFATHCVTRLRFNLADQALVDRDAVRAVPGVLGEQYSGEQYQVIIGPTVTHVYNEVARSVASSIRLLSTRTSIRSRRKLKSSLLRRRASVTPSLTR